MGARHEAKHNIGDSYKLLKDLRHRDAEKVRGDLKHIHGHEVNIKRDLKKKDY